MSSCTLVSVNKIYLREREGEMDREREGKILSW